MSKLRYNAFLKVIIIGGLILLLLIPALLIGHLVDERQQLQRDAISDVSSKWADSQTVTGPYIAIPYYEHSVDGKSIETHYLYIMPENLKITGDVSTQKLHRGIYDVVVYHSDLKLDGNFGNVDFCGIPKERLRFDKAALCMGINDLRGIENRPVIRLNNENLDCDAGLPTQDVAKQGVQTMISVSDSTLNELAFSVSLKLKGSESLWFCPVGANTEVQLTSDWTNPSFKGSFLPSDRTVDESGFTSVWRMSHLNRDFPRSWTKKCLREYSPVSNKNDSYDYNSSANYSRVSGSDFGVELLLPVDGYQKTERCVKYSILFTTITFLVFFFVEISRKKLLHPLHYLLVGAALIIFYTLLLSISEYVAFNIAYMIASLATIILITLYSKAVLKSWKLGLFVGGVLVILYGYMFTILQLQDYALLAGSIFVFVVLCLVMYFSRKVDWYNLAEHGANNETPSTTENK